MTGLSLLQTTAIPFGALTDFHLVTTGTGPLLVGTHPDGACTWDPARDRWAAHRLDSPWRPGEQNGRPTVPSALRAVVVDGRILVGGGAPDLWFTLWDLDSGAVRTFADPRERWGVDTISTLELPGRSMFLVGSFSGGVGVALWDVVGNGTAERTGEVMDWCDRSAATGMLGHRPVLIIGDDSGSGKVWVRDLDYGGHPFAEFDEDLEIGGDEEHLVAFGLANVGGRPRVVAAGANGSVVLGDIDSGEWGEPFAGSAWHEEPTEMLVDTGTVNDAPIAVTMEYREDYLPLDPHFTSVLRAWDLEGGHALGEPVTAHEGEALGIQLIELDGRTVAVTVGRGDASVRVWALDQ